MISHVVLLALKPGVDLDECAAIMDGLNALVPQINGFEAFTHGPNRDFEEKSQQFPYGFICHFANQKALGRYHEDPRHQALGARLVELCTEGAKGIMVADIETA